MQPRQLTSISNFDQTFPAFAIRLLNAKKKNLTDDQIAFLIYCCEEKASWRSLQFSQQLKMD